MSRNLLKSDGNLLQLHKQTQLVSFPECLGKKLNNFLLDGLTGNVRIHIRDGRILGLSIEEKVSISS